MAVLRLSAWLCGLCGLCGLWLASAAQTPQQPPAGASAGPPQEEVIVAAPEPRYVAPTLRDRIGRVWAPVYINGQGPLRLVLDTGASASAITALAAARLGLPLDSAHTVLLRGVTGAREVPVIKVDRIEFGDLTVEPAKLLVIDDAFGGAEGVLAGRGLNDRRIEIEFRRDRIDIRRSRNQRPAPGFTTLPVKLIRGHVPTVEAGVGRIQVKAVIDTGAQLTSGNLALREALLRQRRRLVEQPDEIIGVTGDSQEGPTSAVPPILLGDVLIRNAHITFVDLHIFKHWKLTDEPAILIGMDVLGVLDTLIIDYRRREMQIRLVRGGA
jgi:predicted aspartyl protease